MSYEDLVGDTSLDLIYISLPNHLHEEWVLRALDHGKHVICEKPLGLSVASVSRMVDRARSRGLLLFENLMFLHHPQHCAVKNVIDRGEIGRIRTVRSVFSFPCPPAGNFRLDPGRGGGAFHDLARYPLGTAWYFLQGRCLDFSGYMLDHKGLNVAVHGTALTTAQEVFIYTLAFGLPYECRYEIVGEQGSIRVDRAYTTPADMANNIRVVSGGTDASFTVPPADHFHLMIEDVCALIIQGRSFEEIHTRTLHLVEMAEQMEKGCRHEELRQ